MELRQPRAGETRREVSPSEAGALLNSVLDAGINLVDTSPDYGRSEELIGQFISHRRSEFFLASKCGCAINPPPGERPPHVFTRENVRAGVEQSLRRLKTDHLDLVQFHMSPARKEIVGTSNPQHLAENVAHAAKGPLPADQVSAAKKRLGAVL